MVQCMLVTLHSVSGRDTAQALCESCLESLSQASGGYSHQLCLRTGVRSFIRCPCNRPSMHGTLTQKGAAGIWAQVRQRCSQTLTA